MGYNKVIYGGRVLVDLTTDTVTPDKVLSGYTTHDKSGESITGTCTFDVDSTSATAAVAEILIGKTAYARGIELTGIMPNNGGIEGNITTLSERYNIPHGYHDGSGVVQIAPEEQSKLLASNIRQGVTILGVTGSMSSGEGFNPQAKEVTPSTQSQTVLPDDGYNCLSEVTVLSIPYVESGNAAGGITVTIG